ncbi:MAG: nucleotidyltransferase family protein [Allosphingosinicella sp.]|uniref:nucleotidyltransferase family protein n=1 Tax=Allosphingosinicella sp. TaxID=2823234 RepID=UPI00395600C7
MTRQEVLRRLNESEPELRKLGIGKLYLFGSAARGKPATNDAGLLYEPGSVLFGFMALAGAMIRLEEILGSKVALIARERLGG